MSLFHVLGHTKGSVLAKNTGIHFGVTRSIFKARSCKHLAQPQGWRTTPCRLSLIAYSIYLQQLSILEAVPLFATWGLAMLWWLGSTYHGTTEFIVPKWNRIVT